MTRPTCLPDEDLLPLVAGEPASPGVQEHLDNCSRCREHLGRLRAAVAALRMMVAMPAEGCGSVSMPVEGPSNAHSGASSTIDLRSFRSRIPSLPEAYRVVRLLGIGSFAEVWLAEDLNLGRKVAVKALRPRSDPTARARTLEVLRNDAHRLAELRHSNIVQVYAWQEAGDDPCLLLQYVAGGSLTDRLRESGPLGWQEASRFVADVGEGLLEVHARGVVHRDIKPSNILWDPETDEALLTDFGVAARLADDVTTVAGTPPYMAPEAFDGRLGPAMDVYSLAATLFHLATGTLPFPGPAIADLRRQIAQGLPEPDPRCRVLPEPLERLIRSGLAEEPGRRPDLREFITTLRGTLNQLLADTLIRRREEPGSAVPVDLRLVVSRQISPGVYQPIAATHPMKKRWPTRDMEKVPQPPEQVVLRTGDRVRVEVVADRRGYLAVFNIGPTGNLNLLHPVAPTATPPPPLEAHRPLHVLDVQMTPPAGRERLFAVWSRRPVPLERLVSLARADGSLGSRPYHATRDMERVQDSLQELGPEDHYAIVLEVDHLP